MDNEDLTFARILYVTERRDLLAEASRTLFGVGFLVWMVASALDNILALEIFLGIRMS